MEPRKFPHKQGSAAVRIKKETWNVTGHRPTHKNWWPREMPRMNRGNCGRDKPRIMSQKLKTKNYKRKVGIQKRKYKRSIWNKTNRVVGKSFPCFPVQHCWMALKSDSNKLLINLHLNFTRLSSPCWNSVRSKRIPYFAQSQFQSEIFRKHQSH